MQELRIENYTIAFTSKEFGPVFQNMFDKKHYEKGVGTMLSQLYYGEEYLTSLSTRGANKKPRYIPEGIYTTMFAGMQELENYICKEAVTQGLGRRILMVGALSEKWYPPIDKKREQYYPELDGIVDKIIERRKYLKGCLKENQKQPSNWDKKQQRIICILEPSVEKAINEVSRIRDAKIDAEQKSAHKVSLEALARQSDWEHLFRLTMCATIANVGELKFADGIGYHDAMFDDSYKMAKEFLDKVVEFVKGKYDSIGEETFKPTNVREAEMKVYSKIEESMPEGITANQLRQKLGWQKKDVYDAINTLEDDEKIHSRNVGTTKPKWVWLIGPERKGGNQGD